MISLDTLNEKWEVIVIGSGPAGLAAAVAAAESGAEVCIIEREERPGGILKQCIHDGFGLLRFQEKLSGPEYAYRYLEMAANRRIPILGNTFVLKIQREDTGFGLTLQESGRGVFKLQAKAVVYAAGCRERTSRQVYVHGDRPSGIFTAGTLQYMINIQGYMPAKKCVILGSGDIGLIMARRLVLEGAEVEGVYEIKPEPSGLTRNVVQCLDDFGTPLHLSTTVTEIHGQKRVTGVTVCKVDNDAVPFRGTEKYIPCDTLVLSVGLIPENDLLETLGLGLDPTTGGPPVDQYNMTALEGLFVCGNALHVNDLVDYVSESGVLAGQAAADYARYGRKRSRCLQIIPGSGIRYVVPQLWDSAGERNLILYFRSSQTVFQAVLEVISGDRVLRTEKYPVLRPPEMQRLELKAEDFSEPLQDLEFRIREVKI